MKTNKLLLVFIGILASVGSSSGEGIVSNDFVNSSRSGNQTRFRRNADPLSDKLSDPDLQFSTSSTSNQTRSRRNADPLSDYYGKLSTVARISNGISLLAGLINKNIPIDTVIEELLHFGNVKLADVVALQKDTVEAVISQLESTNKSLVTSSAGDILEETTIGMGRVREAFIESDFGNFKHPDDYFKEAQSFKDDTTTDYSVVQSTTTVVKEALEKIEKLKNPPSVIDAMNFADFGSPINILRARLVSVESAPASFATIVQKLESLSKLSDGEAILKPMQQTLDLLAVHRDLSPVNPSDVVEAGKNFDAISPLSSAFAQSNLAVLTDLVFSRLKTSLTKRQYTPGFPNGASDLKKLVKDIRDPSFETTIGSGKNFARLSAGLKPLERFSAKVEASEAQLKQMSTVEVLKSVGSALELQTLMTELIVTSADAADVTKILIDNQFFLWPKNRVAPVVELMGNVVKVSGELARIKSSASAFPPPPQEVTDVKEILKKLPAKIGENEVQNVINELKSVPEKVEKVKEYLNKLQKFLNDVPDPTATRKTVDLVVKAEGDLRKIKNEIDRDVVPKLTVIRDMKEPIDKVVRALKATKVIKDFKPEDISKIRSAVDTIGKAASSIKDLQKKPTSRKKRQTDEVKELIAFKIAPKPAATLGSAAAMINSMNQLKGMETTVVQDLKVNSQTFDTEVVKVTDGSKKSEILKKWGDHKSFLASLDSTLGQIKAFGAKLSVDKNLRKLGDPLKNAKAVGDVTQNIADKSEAVGILILETSDANAKAELEKLKTQLDTLAALDLQFSNHHSVLPNVPRALKSFFDFVTGFLTPKEDSSGLYAGPLVTPPPEPPLAWWLYLLFGGFAILIGYLLWILGETLYNSQVGFAKVQKIYFKKALKQNCFSATAMATGALNDLKDEDKGANHGFLKVPEEKMRYPDPVIWRTRVWRFLSLVGLRPYIDANYISVPGSNKYIATQGPMAKDEQPGKVDAIADFWEMVFAHGTDTIVQLCNFYELDDFEVYFSCPNRIPSRKCSKYYPLEKGETLSFGDYTITNEEHDTCFKGYVELHVLKLTKKGGAARSIELFHHQQWPDHGIPDDLEVVVDMVMVTKKSAKPIVVHCSAGRGRTVSYMAIDLLASYAERHPKTSIDRMLMMIRKQRFGGLQESDQIWLSITGSTMLLAKKNGKMDKIFDRQQMDIINTTKERLREEKYEIGLAGLCIRARNVRIKHAEQAGRETSKDVLNVDRAQIAGLKKVAKIIKMNEEARKESVMRKRLENLEAQRLKRQEEFDDPELRAAHIAAEEAAILKEISVGTSHEVYLKQGARAQLMGKLWIPERLETEIRGQLKKQEEREEKAKEEKKKKEEKEAKKGGKKGKKSSDTTTGSTSKTTSQTGTASKSRKPGGLDNHVAIDIEN